MKNWAGNLQYGASAIHYPRSVEEVCDLVRHYTNVKVLGTRHSFNHIADSPHGNLISLQRLDRVVRYDQLDTNKPTVTIEGGITYGQLCPQLNCKGLALHNLASFPHSSVAGACATATHGSGDRNGNLATAVIAMKVVNADGDVVEVSPETHGEQFAGMVVTLGALGAVVELTLQVEPRYGICQEVYLNLPMQRLRDEFDAIMYRAYSVSLFTDWQGPRFNQVWLKYRVGDEEPVARQPELFEATLATTRMHPVPNQPTDSCTEQLGIRGPWHERLPHFRMDATPSNGIELQTEYLVPREHALEAMDVIYAMRADIIPVLQITEIRTINADDLWMSPCYKQPCVGIHFTWERNLPAVETLLPIIQSRMKGLGARPHWGKLFSTQELDLSGLYGVQLTQFRTLVEQFDSAGKFRNPFLKETIFA